MAGKSHCHKWDRGVAQKSVEGIEPLLGELCRAIPSWLRDNSGEMFWKEFLRHADVIKNQTPRDQLDKVMTRLQGILAMYGLPPPSQWIFREKVDVEFKHRAL
jgi:hypothetical protein